MKPETIDALDRTLLFCEDLVIARGASTRAAIATALTNQSVALVADSANLASGACQSSVVGLARLVLGYGASLRLIFPETPLRGPQPPLRERWLRAGLIDLASDVIPGSGASVAEATRRDDLVFVFGDTPWSGESTSAWRLVAGSWSGATMPTGQSGSRFEGDFPLGALAAAAIASVEPFKAAMRSLGVTLRVPEQIELVQRAQFQLAPPGTAIGPIDLGRIDCISGGAITNGLLFSLLRVPGIRGAARVIEPEKADLSNLNRYVLLRCGGVERPKVELLSEWQSPEFAISGEQVPLNAETVASLRPFAPRVFVGADRVPARWQAQQEWPAWLCIGATDDFFAQVTEHAPGTACAGCAFPQSIPNPPLYIPTASFVSFWAGLVSAARFVRHSLGIPYGDGERSFSLYGPARMDGAAWTWTALSPSASCRLGCRSLIPTRD